MIAEQARVRAIDVDVVCSSVDERRRRVESRFPDLAVTGCRRGARSSSVTTAHESRADRDRHNTIDGIGAILTAVASGRVHVLRRSSRNFHGIVEGDGDLEGLSRRSVDRLRVGRILAVHPKRGARRRRGLCVPVTGRIVGCAHKCWDSLNICSSPLESSVPLSKRVCISVISSYFLYGSPLKRTAVPAFSVRVRHWCIRSRSSEASARSRRASGYPSPV
jgi:hypothetical protein